MQQIDKLSFRGSGWFTLLVSSFFRVHGNIWNPATRKVLRRRFNVCETSCTFPNETHRKSPSVSHIHKWVSVSNVLHIETPRKASAQWENHHCHSQYNYCSWVSLYFSISSFPTVLDLCWHSDHFRKALLLLVCSQCYIPENICFLKLPSPPVGNL